MNEKKLKELYRFSILSAKDNLEYEAFLEKLMKFMEPNEWEEMITNQEQDEIMKYDTIKTYLLLNKFLINNVYKLVSQEIKEEKYEKNENGLDENNLEEKVQADKIDLIKKLQKYNTATIKNINLKILDEKYTKILNFEQLSTIVSYPEIQEALLCLEDNELECLDVGLKEYIEREKKIIKKEEQSDWNYEFEQYLVAFFSGQYNDIIKEISKIKDEKERKEKYKQLSYIITMPNFFNIKTIEQLEKYSEIKKEVCGKIIKKEDLNEYPLIKKMNNVQKNRFAILQHYGIYSGAEIIKMFDPDKFNDYQEKPFFFQILEQIKKIYQIKDENILNSIANNLYEKKYLDEKECSARILEKSIKMFIEDDYNKELTRIDQIPEMDDEKKKEYGINDAECEIRDATDIDFNLMVTSISAYSYDENEVTSDSYYEHWNTPYKKAQFACYSHISPENLETADIIETLIGISEVKGIQYVSPYDSYTKSQLMSPKSKIIGYLKFKDLAKYKSMTEINCKKINPTYIPLMKKQGQIINFEQAKKAAKDFSIGTGKNIPIVFIDADKIRDKQLEKNKEIQKKYDNYAEK